MNVHNGIHLQREGVFGEAVSEEVNGGQPKLVLGRVDDQSMLAESFKKSPEMGHVFHSGCAADEDIIKVDEDERQVSQHCVHWALEGLCCIL